MSKRVFQLIMWNIDCSSYVLQYLDAGQGGALAGGSVRRHTSGLQELLLLLKQPNAHHKALLFAGGKFWVFAPGPTKSVRLALTMICHISESISLMFLNLHDRISIETKYKNKNRRNLGQKAITRLDWSRPTWPTKILRHGTLGATSAPPGPLGPAGLGMAWHNAGLWAGDNMKYHEITLW